MPRKLLDSLKFTTSSGVYCPSLFPAIAAVKNNLSRVSLDSALVRTKILGLPY